MARTFRNVILETLKARAPGKTMCPSEALPVADRRDKDLMAKVRMVAYRLSEEGMIVVTAGGVEVDPLTHRGPIRLGLRND